MYYKGPEIYSNEDESELDSVIEAIQSIKEKDKMEILKQKIEDLLNLLEEKIHRSLSANVEQSYLEMQNRNLVLRVENLKNIINCVVNNKSFEIGSNTEHYANSVVPTPEGVKIAFSEGMSPGAIKILAGYDINSAISLDPEHFELSEIDSIEGEVRDENLRKSTCRHIHGVIRKELIKHIVLRIPSMLFPKDKLTSFEIEHPGAYVFRYIKLD